MKKPDRKRKTHYESSLYFPEAPMVIKIIAIDSRMVVISGDWEFLLNDCGIQFEKTESFGDEWW